MGNVWAKRIPVNRVTVDMLEMPPNSASISPRKQLLTARLCARVLRTRDSRATCRQTDVDTLKTFLGGRDNAAAVALTGPRSRLEAEIGTAARHPDGRTITAAARNHLEVILRAAYSPQRYTAFHRQRLLSDHVLVSLEVILQAFL